MNIKKKIYQNYYSPLHITEKRLRRLGDMLANLEYRVETDDAEFTSIEELLSGCTTPIKNLEIELTVPMGRISFLQSSSKFNIKQSHGEAVEVFNRLDRLFSRWERQPKVLYDVSLVTLLNILLIISYNIFGLLFFPILLGGIGWELYLIFYVYTTEYTKLEVGSKELKVELS